MKMIYDYNKAFLQFSTPVGIKYALQLRPMITVVVGDSGTGKTYLAETIQNMKQIQASFGNTAEFSNVGVFNGTLIEDKESLVIIDKSEQQFSDQIHDWVLNAKKLHFLIFARGNLDLRLTPNYYGEFKREKDVIQMYYRFSERLWFN